MTSLLAQPVDRAPNALARLLVTVREPFLGAYRAVGFLTQETDGFGFAYLRKELARSDFRPLPGLARASTSSAHSPALFPLFAERVLAARRPDRPASLAALGLGVDAAPFEVLVRSHGQRVGDTIELLPAPDAAAGDAVSFTFLTHGVRYLPAENQARITALHEGDRLLLELDPENDVNSRAQVVTDEGHIRLGWLPDPLIEVIESIDERRLTVERANGPEVGFHFRLLVRIEGRLSADAERLFSGPAWLVQD